MPPTRWFMVVAGGLLIADVASAATYGLEPLSQGEVYAFLFEETAAYQSCDADWMAQHHVPNATYSYQVPGKPPVVQRFEEVLRTFRKWCTPSYKRVSFNQRSWSVKVGGSEATVRRQDAEGPFQFFASVLDLFHLKPREVQSVSTNNTLIRGMDGKIKLKAVRWFIELRASDRR